MTDHDDYNGTTVNDNDTISDGYYNELQAITGHVGTNGSLMSPIGSVVAWLKTFDSQDSGTTDSTTANKLVQSGQNFNTTVSVGNVVHNTTDDTFAYVTAVDSDTTLSIDSDIMVSGEAYTIYATPKLPIGWSEADGSVVSDANSPFNGATLPDLNGGTYKLLRGASTSGSTGGSDTKDVSHSHTVPITKYASTPNNGCANDGAKGNYDATSTTDGSTTQDVVPAYYEVVWIIRIK